MFLSCRSALKVAEVDLAAARSHVQQFQDISQANEAALAALNATHDEYMASSEAQLTKQEVCFVWEAIFFPLTRRTE
jgi:nucleoprotein TPR